MSRLTWLLDWMLEDGTGPAPGEEELAWRAACVRGAKLTALGLCATYAVWVLGASMAKRSAQPHEALGQVVWLGDASYTKGSSGGRMRASSSHRVWMDGVRVLLDGSSEPVEYTTGPNSGLRKFAIGERVRVNYRQGTWLFWDELRITAISKLTDVDRQSHRAP